jgi:hypothetical protein
VIICPLCAVDERPLEDLLSFIGEPSKPTSKQSKAAHHVDLAQLESIALTSSSASDTFMLSESSKKKKSKKKKSKGPNDEQSSPTSISVSHGECSAVGIDIAGENQCGDVDKHANAVAKCDSQLHLRVAAANGTIIATPTPNPANMNMEGSGGEHIVTAKRKHKKPQVISTVRSPNFLLFFSFFLEH